MTVYIVTQGSYSDYHIEAVFTDKEQAQLYCAIHHDKSGWYDPCVIEEYETDTPKLETDKELTEEWVGIFYVDGRTSFGKEGFALKSRNVVEFHRAALSRQMHYFRVVVYLPIDTPEDKAKKVICDFFAKYRAEQLGVT